MLECLKKIYLSTHDPGADLLTSIREDSSANSLCVKPLQVLCVVRHLASINSTGDHYHQQGQRVWRVHISFGGCLDTRRGWWPDPAAQCIWPKPVQPQIGTFIPAHPTSQMFHWHPALSCWSHLKRVRSKMLILSSCKSKEWKYKSF